MPSIARLEGSTGAIFNSINKGQIESIEIQLPPLPEQKRIVAKLDTVFKHSEQAHQATTKQVADLSSPQICNSCARAAKQGSMSAKTQPNEGSNLLNFSIKNLGTTQKGEFIQKPLTVFCGPNNSGKTWAMYALYSFYRWAGGVHRYWLRAQAMPKAVQEKAQIEKERLIEVAEELMNLSDFHRTLNGNFADYFNLPSELFVDTEFKRDCSQKDWLEWIKNYPQPNVFLMPAERSGLHLIYREMSNRRTALLHNPPKKDIDAQSKLLQDISSYTQPIADYIDWLNAMKMQNKTPKESHKEFHKEATFLQEELVQGHFHLDDKTGDVTYTPTTRQGIPNHTLSLHAASSAVKSLLGLWFYLEHQAESGDILMIDEPELNLHPENQIVIAHLLARLVNAGIQVVISTHSDYIVREVNNLTILSEDSNGELLNSLNKKGVINCKQDSILKPEKVGMYLFDNATVEPFDFKRGEGFAVKTFDEVITRQNESSDQIYQELKYGSIDK